MVQVTARLSALPIGSGSPRAGDGPPTALAVGSRSCRSAEGRGPLQQARQLSQAARRAAVDPLPLLLAVGIEHELLPVGQHPLGRQAPLSEQKGTAVSAEGRSSPIQQVALVFCGPQLDPAGLGRPLALRLGAGQGNNRPERTDTVR